MRPAAALFATVLLSASALAHEPPTATGVGFDDSGRVYVRTNRGIVVSDSDRGVWRLLCNSAYGINTTEVPRWVVRASGEVVMSTSGGLLRGTNGLCRWDPVAPELGGVLMAGLAADPASPDSLFAIRTTDGKHTDLFASTDGGGTWGAVGAQIADSYYQDLLVAPSTPSRLYASGLSFDAGVSLSFVAVSDDGGLTWTEHPVTLEPSEGAFVALAVHPTDAERLYATARATSPLDPDRLLITVDGGASFTTTLTEVGLTAVAFAADGRAAWAGSAAGISRSDDGGTSFGPAGGPVTDVSCLVEHDGELWLCGRFGLELGIGVSVDDGATFRQILAFPDVAAPLDCAGTETASVCESLWQEWILEVVAPAARPSVDGGAVRPSSTFDGGIALPPSAFDSGLVGGASAAPVAQAGCGCRALGARPPPGGGLGWEALAVAVSLLVVGTWRRDRE